MVSLEGDGSDAIEGSLSRPPVKLTARGDVCREQLKGKDEEAQCPGEADDRGCIVERVGCIDPQSLEVLRPLFIPLVVPRAVLDP